MISVLIPYLAYPPYNEQIDITLDGLSRQTADIEVIISEQPIVEKHTRIRKGRLNNQGFAKSSGDVIFHCDADIIFKDETLLQRMYDALFERDLDVIYPLFWSNSAKMLKLADGHPFMRRDVYQEFSPENEDDLGVSLQSFRLLEWLYFNKRFHASDEFVFDVNLLPFIKRLHKHDPDTKEKCMPIAIRVVTELKKEGLWPVWGKEKDA